MTVCVLGGDAGPAPWTETAAAAVASAGGWVRLVLVDDEADAAEVSPTGDTAGASNLTATVAGEILADTRVILAVSTAPLEAIEAAFATASGQAARKIVDIAHCADADAGVLSMFAVADMLIFTPQAIAAALGWDAEPDDVQALARVQRLLARANQAAVVRFPASGAAAIWADRTMFVETSAASHSAGAGARFSGTIAAAVAQGIGPEPALAMALAAAAVSDREVLLGDEDDDV